MTQIWSELMTNANIFDNGDAGYASQTCVDDKHSCCSPLICHKHGNEFVR